MKVILVVFISCSLIILSCDSAEHTHHDSVVITKTEANKPDTAKKSIKAYVQNKIGDGRFVIKYHSPAVRNRVIWGGLVSYDQVWVTGAHNATSVESNKDFMIGEKKIPAGKYAFFTIPGKDEWTIILNKNWEQHLADEYKQADDLVRMKIKPDTLDYKQERLMYDIDPWAQKEGNLLMIWEKLKLVIPVRIAD